VIEAESLLSETRAYVKSMIDTVSPGSLKASRRQIYADQHRSVDQAVAESETLLQAMMKQNDYREGVAAFLEKRHPVWTDS
jgi:enoyl-CoA hydratase/carnithine racemase